MMSESEKLRKIAERFQVADFYVFGSRAKEIAARFQQSVEPERALTSVQAGTVSDVDIGAMLRRGVKLTAKDRVCLMIELEDILAVNRVDLVVLPEA